MENSKASRSLSSSRLNYKLTTLRNENKKVLESQRVHETMNESLNETLRGFERMHINRQSLDNSIHEDDGVKVPHGGYRRILDAIDEETKPDEPYKIRVKTDSRSRLNQRRSNSKRGFQESNSAYKFEGSSNKKNKHIENDHTIANTKEENQISPSKLKSQLRPIGIVENTVINNNEVQIKYTNEKPIQGAEIWEESPEKQFKQPDNTKQDIRSPPKHRRIKTLDDQKELESLSYVPDVAPTIHHASKNNNLIPLIQAAPIHSLEEPVKRQGLKSRSVNKQRFDNPRDKQNNYNDGNLKSFTNTQKESSRGLSTTLNSSRLQLLKNQTNRQLTSNLNSSKENFEPMSKRTLNNRRFSKVSLESRDHSRSHKLNQVQVPAATAAKIERFSRQISKLASNFDVVSGFLNSTPSDDARAFEKDIRKGLLDLERNVKSFLERSCHPI